MLLNNHDIAIEIERTISSEFNKSFRHSPTIFSADQIELRSFADVLVILLALKSDKECLDFIDKIACYQNQRMSDIPDTKQIYLEFLELL